MAGLAPAAPREGAARTGLAGSLTAVLVIAAVLLAGHSPGLAAPPAASSAPDERDAVPGELIVRYEPGVAPAVRDRIRREADTWAAEPMLLPRAHVLRVRSGQTVQRAVRELERSPGVEYAEPNYILPLAATPDDPRFPDQWALRNTGQVVGGQPGIPGVDIGAVEAWDTTTGSSDVKVAIVDTAFDVEHPDLVDSVWLNPGEIGDGRESNGIDDDGNGYVDDWRGWDFEDDDNDPSPTDGSTHGTEVAGVVGATGDNGIGVTGVNWEVGLMAFRAGIDGGIPTSQSADAFLYAIDKGVDVINGSFGAPGPPNVTHQAIISSASHVLFVFAAGNSSGNNDVTPFYPCNYGAAGLANVICVASTDNRDQKAGSSHYGAGTVHLGAPGVQVPTTTILGNGYRPVNGTSFASPLVAGAAALVKSAFPGATPVQLKNLILDGTDLTAAMLGATISGGRLNVASSLAIPADATPPATFNLWTPASGNHVNSATPNLTWFETTDAGSGLKKYQLLMRESANPPGSYQVVRDDILPGTTATTPPAPLQHGKQYDWYVRAWDKAGHVRNSLSVRTFTVDTVPPALFALAFPADGFATKGQSSQTFFWQPSSDANLAGYDLLVNGQQVATVGPAITQRSLDLEPMGEGHHTWTVRARDHAGNVRTAQSRTFTIDRSPPSIPVRIVPAAGAAVAGLTPTFQWHAADDSLTSVAEYELAIWTSLGPVETKVVGPSTLSTTFDTTLADGPYRWTIRSRDVLGNESFSAPPWEFLVDTVPPDAFGLGPPADGAETEDASPTFSWAPSSDEGSGLAGYELVVEGEVARDGIDPGATEATPEDPLAPGQHTWTVRAVDGAGHVTEANEKRTLTVLEPEDPGQPPDPPDLPDPPDPPDPGGNGQGQPGEGARLALAVRTRQRVGRMAVTVGCGQLACAARLAGRLIVRPANRRAARRAGLPLNRGFALRPVAVSVTADGRRAVRLRIRGNRRQLAAARRLLRNPNLRRGSIVRVQARAEAAGEVHRGRVVFRPRP